MQNPDIKNTLIDREHNMTYHIMAYRKTTYEESIAAIRSYHSQPQFRRRKTPMKNKVITIVTIIGYNE